MADLFDESLRHLAAEEATSAYSAGAVVSVPLEQREAGSLGWSASILPSTPGAPPGKPESASQVFLFVVPGTGRAGRGASPPLLGARWEEFAFIREHPGPPRILLLARGASGESRERLRDWAERLFRHLVDELA